VSLRQLDETLSTIRSSAHRFDRIQKLAPGEVVDIEFDLLPFGLAFSPGEQLHLIISGHSLLGPMMPGIDENVAAESGQHVIRTGQGPRVLSATAPPIQETQDGPAVQTGDGAPWAPYPQWSA
jgi:predicted acyl esterase